MKNITLGNTGIQVTELCFGALPIGPNQKNVPVEDASETIAHALRRGIRFIDTAQGYRTYPHIRLALDKTGIRPVISSKSMETTYEGMAKAVDDCLEALGVGQVDIFYLHASRAGTDVFEARKDALRALLDCKARGRIRAVGISTHNVLVTRLAAQHSDIDIVFPIINFKGLGIVDGTRREMEEAIEACFASGKGVCFMKALGGGNLADRYIQALDYARELSGGRAAIAMGTVNIPETDVAVSYFNGEDVSDVFKNFKLSQKKFITLRSQCISCGSCVEACHSGAVSLGGEGIPVFDEDACLTCGYCVAACPRFAIRMV